jgi:hypothetical protein
MPPWCQGSPFHVPILWPQAKDVPETAAASLPEGGEVATGSVQVLATMGAVNDFFHDAALGMSETGAGLGSFGTGWAPAGEAVDVGWKRQSSGPPKIPSGFTAPLDPSGFIKAPPGACGAGASPSVRFVAPGNEAEGEVLEPVTPDLFAEIGATTLSYDFLVGEGNETVDLETFMSQQLQPGDMRLLTAAGWEEVLWNPLRDRQQRVESLMDYYLWTVSPELETTVSQAISDRLSSMGVPGEVSQAFEESEQAGWFAAPLPAPEYELAGMQIEAEFSGGLEGNIDEEREFTIPVPGEMPMFGPMTGDGNLVFTHPTLGEFHFEVLLDWDHWDEMGRVDGGTLRMTDEARGYEIVLSICPDGTREGDILFEGTKVGTVSMDVVGNSTYLDVKSSESYGLPSVSP